MTSIHEKKGTFSKQSLISIRIPAVIDHYITFINGKSGHIPAVGRELAPPPVVPNRAISGVNVDEVCVPAIGFRFLLIGFVVKSVD